MFAPMPPDALDACRGRQGRLLRGLLWRRRVIAKLDPPPLDRDHERGGAGMDSQRPHERRHDVLEARGAQRQLLGDIRAVQAVGHGVKHHEVAVRERARPGIVRAASAGSAGWRRAREAEIADQARHRVLSDN